MSAQRRSATKQRPSAADVAPARSERATPRTAAAQQRSVKAAGERSKPAATALPSRLVTRTAAVRQLARDTWAEMKKVNWPDQQTTRNLTIVVIAISAVLGLLLGAIDFLLVKLLEAL